VKRISANMTPSALALSKNPVSIGVLDIFGFEVMPTNSFEQLCINFANEKLHNQFIGHVFKSDLAEYENEGLKIEMDYQDNSECVQMVEGQHGSVLALLQEQCQLGQRGSDQAWAENMANTLAKNASFSKPRVGVSLFTIHHYAGEVTYDSAGCIEKNKDDINTDLEAVLVSCAPNVQTALDEGNLFGAAQASGGGGGGRGKGMQTVSKAFKSQLAQLVTVLNAAYPHYVRCVKSTETKMPDTFDGQKVCSQLLYSGVLETVKIRKAGYAVRLPLEEFMRRFDCILRLGGSSGGGESSALLQQVMAKVGLTETSWIFGKTKVFIKEERMLNLLEAAREEALRASVVLIQSYMRRRLARKLLARLREQERQRKIAEDRKRRAKEIEAEEAQERERKRLEAEAEAKRLHEAGVAQKLIEEQQEKQRQEEELLRKRKEAAAAAERKREEMEHRLSFSFTLAGDVRRKLAPLAVSIASSDTDHDAVVVLNGVHEGWLWKEGGQEGFKKRMKDLLFTNYDRRFFVLYETGRAAYFADQDMTVLLKELHLDSQSTVTEINTPKGLAESDVGRYFLLIDTPERKMKVAAETGLERAEWKKALLKVIKTLGGDPGEEEVDDSKVDVHFPDRSKMTLNVTPGTTMRQVYLQVAKRLHIEPVFLQYYALCEQKLSPDGTRPCLRLVNQRHKLASKMPRLRALELRFVFRKVISPGDAEAEAAITDTSTLAQDFMYSQEVYNFLTAYPSSDTQALDLAAIQLKLSRPEADSEPAEKLMDDLHEFLPNSMLPRLSEKRAEWTQRVLDAALALGGAGASTLKGIYLEKARKQAPYGSFAFNVTQVGAGEPVPLLFLVNLRGLHLIEPTGQRLLSTVVFNNLIKYSRKGKNTVSLTVAGVLSGSAQKEVQWAFETSDAGEICRVIKILLQLKVQERDSKAAPVVVADGA